ncbi:hypothetical protein VCUG_02512 [Vavraia culicis subsp. floridensis]|uniref:Matrin-type domain-containing protein n=1 Tax=Vavraia culicis (isolate floridensis) TaxID=948595 RepID=L2GQS7_VAVCU|nr:uncharacterized protein VCUG_02512 [Vavraia culicis subsp. floridensis]ELA46001.1 hypothetical protein VCUG_02512 [Vavraia culicis subsp. floridensis]
MPKYFCPFCDISLPNSLYRLRKTHINGKKHKLMRRAYYLELLENKDVRKELFNKIDKSLMVKRAFIMPKLKKIPVVPEIPRNINVFRLPEDFNFEDRRNYGVKLDEIRTILDGNYH